MAHRILACLLLLAVVPACGPTQAEIQKRKDDALYHYKLAYGHFFDTRASNGDAALQQVLKSLEIDPDNPDAQLLAGIIFMGREQYLRAIEHYQKALALRPDFHYALNNLGTTYLAMGRWDDAAAIYEKLVVTDTYDRPAVAHNNLAWALYKKGDLDRAQNHYHEAMKLQPELCPPYNNLGMLHIDRRELDLAEKYLRRGVERCPQYAEPHYHLGRVEAEQADLGAARKNFRRCVELVAHTLLGDRCQSRLATLPPEPLPEQAYDDELRPRAPEIVP